MVSDNAVFPPVLYAKPSITEKEIAFVKNAVEHGWGQQCNYWLDRFEDTFAGYMGSPHAVATSSATGALHLGLAALGIGPGDEVIIADTNWIASVAPVVHLGATPVFVDIREDTWCLDPVAVQQAVTPRTRAILAVHLYGNLCDMAALETIASAHNLYLIEDAAEAVGSGWGVRKAGARGKFGIFSLHGTKTLSTGEGGVFVTADDDLAARVRILNNHGRVPGDARQFFATAVGYKFKMGSLQAALGCAQVERARELVERRREIFFQYHSVLSEHPDLAMNPVPELPVQYGYWMPAMVFSERCGVSQTEMLEAFKNSNIDGRAFFSPLSGQARFTPCRSNLVSYSIAPRGVNLPSYHDMTESDIKRVCDVVFEVLEKHCRRP